LVRAAPRDFICISRNGCAGTTCMNETETAAGDDWLNMAIASLIAVAREDGLSDEAIIAGLTDTVEALREGLG
jgi:hypothetical protein